MAHESFYALCGGPWDANIRDAPREESDDEDNMNVVGSGYCPERITQEEID